jgi:hypothetical protein
MIASKSSAMKTSTFKLPKASSLPDHVRGSGKTDPSAQPRSRVAPFGDIHAVVTLLSTDGGREMDTTVPLFRLATKQKLPAAGN